MNAPSLRTFASLYGGGTYAGPGPLVGRLVANTQFLRALFRHGSFERYWFFIGEEADRAGLAQLVAGALDPSRLVVRNRLDLPRALAAGDLDVVHHASHVDEFTDLLSLRNRHAQKPVTVTGQIHSLSYPRILFSHVLTLLESPSPCDAIFCSSHDGRDAVLKSFAAAHRHLASRGAAVAAPACEFPVVPLGINVDASAAGDRTAERVRLAVPDDAVVLLGVGRFTEYDKSDLFPLLVILAHVIARAARPVYVVLAGARQGTQTPEMIEHWARALGIADRVRICVDFPDERKPDLLAAADIFLSLVDNVQETFGLSVIEAMSAGLPIVASDFDGFKDTVTDEVGVRVATRWACDPQTLAECGGLLYERPLHLFFGQSVEIDLRDLEAKVTRLVNDPGLRQRLGAAASARAQAECDWKYIIPRYETVWLRLLAAGEAVPQARRETLGLNLREIFGHYTSQDESQATQNERLVKRSALAAVLCVGKNQYPVYPELKNLIDDAEVMGVLGLAKDTIRLGDLRRTARARVGSDFRADFLLGWLLKHGLLE